MIVCSETGTRPEALVIYDKDAAFSCGRNIDVVGAEPGRRYDHKVFTGIKHVRSYTLRVRTQSARAPCMGPRFNSAVLLLSTTTTSAPPSVSISWPAG